MNHVIYSETIGSGPDVVLLHGWGMHSGIWNTIKYDLAKSYRLTLIDLPGFGYSQSLQPYDDLVAMARAVMAVAPQTAFWLGWSLGGLLAQQIALMDPQRVNKLIIVASTPKFISDSDWPGVSSDTLHQFAMELQRDYAATIKRFLMLQMHGSNASKDDLFDLHEQLMQRGQPMLSALLGGLQILVTTDLRSALPALHCPCLFILGRLDVLIPVALEKKLQHVAPELAVEVIGGAAHLPFISHPTLFLDKVKNFLQKDN